MIQLLLNLLPMISTVFGYYVTGKANRKELDKAIFNFWRNRSITNEAAAEREDILMQRNRIEKAIELSVGAANKLLNEGDVNVPKE